MMGIISFCDGCKRTEEQVKLYTDGHADEIYCKDCLPKYVKPENLEYWEDEMTVTTSE